MPSTELKPGVYVACNGCQGTGRVVDLVIDCMTRGIPLRPASWRQCHVCFGSGKRPITYKWNVKQQEDAVPACPTCGWVAANAAYALVHREEVHP